MLVDVDNHVNRGIRMPLTAGNAQFIMSKCRKSKNIITSQGIASELVLLPYLAVQFKWFFTEPVDR